MQVVKQATKIILETEGVAHAVPFAGFDGATFTNAPNAGAIFVPMMPFHERAAAWPERRRACLAETAAPAGRDPGCLHRSSSPPPPVRGIGNAGGFKMMIQDRRGRGLQALEDAVHGIMPAPPTRRRA